MRKFTFDMKLMATITVQAASEADARAMLNEHINCADTNFGAWPDGSPILGEASIDGFADLVDEPEDYFADT